MDFLMFCFLWIVGGQKGRQQLRAIKAWEVEQYRISSRDLRRTVEVVNEISDRSLLRLEEFARTL